MAFNLFNNKHRKKSKINIKTSIAIVIIAIRFIKLLTHSTFIGSFICIRLLHQNIMRDIIKEMPGTMKLSGKFILGLVSYGDGKID